MNPKLFSVFLCTIFCVSFVRSSPVETKNENETIKIVPTIIPAAVTTLIPSTKEHADLKPTGSKNETVISNKTSESPNSTEPLPIHAATNITQANTTTANTTTNNTTNNTTVPTNVSINNQTTPTSPAPAVPTAAPTEVTTAKPTTTTTMTTTTTVTVSPSPKIAEQDKDRGFDGPSFIGGIVLALGLTGIGFVAYKFCKARTDRNYRNI